MKLIPPVNTLGFRVVVMGVCLWFENPIACLFEQVVMPEHLIFLVRQSPGQTVVHPRVGGSSPNLSHHIGVAVCLVSIFWSTFSPREGLAVLLGFIRNIKFFMESLILAQDERWLRA